MANSVFDIINKSFFLPLSRGNKELNHELLSLLNSKMKDNMSQFEREDVIGWIVECLENHSTMVFIDDDTDEDEGKDYQSIASNKLRYFVRCGWIVEEINNKTFTTTYQMDSSAISVLRSLDEIVQNDTRPVEYAGYVSMIFANLKNFNDAQATETIEQINILSGGLMDNLRGLNGDIKKYLRKILNSEDITPAEILYQLFDLYQSKVIVKNFNNLRRKDNPSKYKDRIIDILNTLLDERMDMLVNDYCAKKIGDNPTIEQKEVAERELRDVIINVISRFESLDDTIKYLEDKNSEYLLAATSRLKFLINESGDIDGMLTGALKLIAKTDDESDEQDFFRLYQLGRADENSLFVQGVKRKKVKSEITEDELTEEDEAEIQRQREMLIRDAEFNVSSINRFVMGQLGERISIEAKQMVLKEKDDLFKVFLAAVYSENTAVEYKITLKDDSFIFDGKEVGNYLIERRETK